MAWDGSKWGQDNFVPTSPDLADILGRMDLNFENSYFFPQTELAMRGSNGIGKGRWAAVGASILIRKNAYLVIFALVSSRRNTRSRAQTSMFTIENQNFLGQIAPEATRRVS